MQLGRRKPDLKKLISETAAPGSPDSECAPPAWQRRPAPVTFFLKADQKMTYVIRGHAIEIASEDEDDEGSEYRALQLERPSKRFLHSTHKFHRQSLRFSYVFRSIFPRMSSSDVPD